jgi:hypothetical protein
MKRIFCFRKFIRVGQVLAGNISGHLGLSKIAINTLLLIEYLPWHNELSYACIEQAQINNLELNYS